MSEEKKEENYWTKIKKFFSKTCHILAIPLSLFLGVICIRNRKDDKNKEIKDIKKDIKKDREELENQKKKVIEIEEILDDLVEDDSQYIKDEKKEQEKRETSIEDVLPDLRK